MAASSVSPTAASRWARVAALPAVAEPACPANAAFASAQLGGPQVVSA